MRTAIFWRWCLALVLLTWALQVYALWSRTWVPLLDLPNHAARHYLEYLKLAGNPPLPCYQIDCRILPNLGADLFLPPLMVLFDPQTACKLFLTLSVFLYWLGQALFIRQCNPEQPCPLIAALLLLPLGFSSQFFWGFLNYYSGVGVAFLALAHFLRLRRLERPPLLELVAHALLVALLFLWHLAVWGIYGVVMGAHLLVELRERYAGEGRLAWRRALLLALPALPGVVLLLIYWSSQDPTAPAQANNWGTWSRKLLAPLRLFRAYDWKTDVGVGVLWLMAVVCLFATPAWRSLKGSGPLLALVLLGIVYLILPFQLGNTSDTDTRLLPAMMVCAVAMLGSLPVRRFHLGMVLLAFCVVLRYGAVVHTWNQLAPRLDSHAEAFALLPHRSRVLPVVLPPFGTKEHPETHFLTWAVLTRQIFDPTLFSLPDQQPLRITCSCPPCVRVTQEAHEILEEPTRACYDFVWVYNSAGKTVHVPPDFQRIFHDESVSVWRVR